MAREQFYRRAIHVARYLSRMLVSVAFKSVVSGLWCLSLMLTLCLFTDVHVPVVSQPRIHSLSWNLP